MRERSPRASAALAIRKRSDRADTALAIRKRRLRLDVALAASVAVLAVAWLYVTAPSIGYARDEGFYFQAATQYGKWLELLVTHPDQALTRSAIDAHFRINAEHPSLMKLLFAISYRVLHQGLGIIATPGQAFRFPAMLISGAATGLIVWWGIRGMSRSAGLVAGLLFLGMPRVFHHAHLACFDMPVTAMILLTVYAYARALYAGRVGWILAVGCCYGLALDTKHNAWMLPLVLGLHLSLTQIFGILPPCTERLPRARSLRQRIRDGLPLVSMLTIGPLVLLLLWPWLWFEPFERLRFWFEFHLHHDYYNMEFLGQTYHRPPMPRGYAWMMTLATVPFTTLTFFLVGLVDSTRHALRGFLLRAESEPHAPAEVLAAWRERSSTDLLWLLCLLAAYAPWWSSSTPIFGGTKHWLSAYPFMCLLAARAFELLRMRLKHVLVAHHARPLLQDGLCVAVTALSVSAPLVMTSHSVPYGLSMYTPLVGGAQGAATLGLNRTFWGYTSIELAEAMSRRLPEGSRVFVHDTALQSWDMHQRDGTIAGNLVPTLNIAASKLGLYHHEPHMRRVEYQLWEIYGTTVPVEIATFDGVPVVWLYARPELGK